MTTVLDAIEEGKKLTAYQIDNLVANRAQRGRNRYRLLVRFRPDTGHSSTNAPCLDTKIECEQLLRECPPREREYFLLIARGYSYREIGSATGANENTVRTRIRRARSQIVGQFRERSARSRT